jgi:uncharacterized Zn-binding protein involved in type VI secretion
MPAAARIFDLSSHGGAAFTPTVATVTIEGQPAIVAGDIHTCVLPNHPPTPLGAGSQKVSIGGRPALRVGDKAGCGGAIAVGAVNVTIG